MYSFFGITTSLDLIKSSYKDILLDELKPYYTDETYNSIVITDDWSSFNPEQISNNPSQHFYYKNSIHIKDKLTEIAFVFDENKKLKKIYFKLITAKTITRRILRKSLNMQFTNRVENIGQIFHENVLIPLTFFFENLTPIHASGFVFDGKTTLLGGTGGTGKTTLEMELCLHHNASFITDDIGIIDQQGFVYPNYNYPKIYAYNLIGNTTLKKTIFKEKSIFNKLHWFLHKTVFGLSKARRKVSPFVLYDKVSKSKTKLDFYSILSKNNIENIQKQELDLQNTIQMSNAVIATEYNYFFNHIKWHEFNALANNDKPIISFDILEKRWQKNLEMVLQTCENNIIKIPMDIPHDEFKKQAVDLMIG